MSDTAPVLNNTYSEALKILLVRPFYPDGGKDYLHWKYLPNGLLKMANYYKTQGHHVELALGNKIPLIAPDVVKITTLFTYWREFTLDAIDFYRFFCPNARIIVGGVDASLNSAEYIKYGVEVSPGVMKEVEDVIPDYSFFPEGSIDFQILHTSRSCKRRCKWCYNYLVEPEFTYKTADQISTEIGKNKITFYDSGILFNPEFKAICKMLASKKVNGRVLSMVESQSGFDARILVADYGEVMSKGWSKEESFVHLIKRARFINPRIAWDNWLTEQPVVERAISLLCEAGFQRKEIQVFMIYNHDLDFSQLEYKRRVCQDLKVQISDCRFRPVQSTFDHYNPRVPQTSKDYHIHPNWTDEQIKAFRRNCRGQNIIARFLAQNRPLLLDYLRKNNVPETVLREYSNKIPWQETADGVIHLPIPN